MSHRPAAILAVLALLAPLLYSCGGGGGGNLPPAGDYCSILTQNQRVHQSMLQNYLWYQDVPQTVDYSQFSTPSQLLDFLRKNPPDRFSFITPSAKFDALFNSGQYAGFGFSFDITPDGRLPIRFVYSASPAWQAGMRRGDEILSVNGQSAAALIAANNWDAVFGPPDAGVTATMQLKKPDGSTVGITMKKAVIQINTVLHSQVISTAVANIGYLVFESFLGTSEAELKQVFANFKAQSVSKVILDLRYNGGGSVQVANSLASWLYGNNRHQIFSQLRYNDLNINRNYTYYLKTLTEGLTIDELIVITSGDTCSASEMVINGLRPFMTVRTVGSTTCGKPVGMSPEKICDKTLVAVNFSVVNANGAGGYFSGLSADCAATDDTRFAFGDVQEPMLKEALFLASNNRCSTVLKPALSPAHSRSPVDPASLRAVTGAW